MADKVTNAQIDAAIKVAPDGTTLDPAKTKGADHRFLLKKLRDYAEGLEYTPITENEVGTHPALSTQDIFNRYVLNQLNGDGAYTPPGTNTTPAAPTVIADDTANTLSASHALGTGEILVSTNGGAYVAYTGQIAVGDVARAAGYWKFKTRAATGRNESPVANSPAFNVAVVLVTAYYGWKADNTTLSAAQIQGGTGVSITSGSDITADYRANTQPMYLWMAEPDSEPAKTKWFGSVDNNGNIGTDEDLFGAPIVANGYRFYITAYQTQNSDTTIQFRKS